MIKSILNDIKNIKKDANIKIDKASLKDFNIFIKKRKLLHKPTIDIKNEIIYITFKRNNEKITIEFLGNNKISYFIFYHEYSSIVLSTTNGVSTIEKFYDILKNLDIEWALDVRPDRKPHR